MSEESEDVGSVIDRDRDHTRARHVRSVVPRLRAVTVLESAAEDVNENRKLLLVRLGRRPDVEVEAVLAHSAASEPVVRIRRSPLHTPRAELVRIANALPVLHRFGLAPAQFTNRRLAERNSLEAAHAVLRRTIGFEGAIRNLDAIRRERWLESGDGKNDKGENRSRSLHGVVTCSGC